MFGQGGRVCEKGATSGCAFWWLNIGDKFRFTRHHFYWGMLCCGNVSHFSSMGACLHGSWLDNEYFTILSTSASDVWWRPLSFCSVVHSPRLCLYSSIGATPCGDKESYAIAEMTCGRRNTMRIEDSHKAREIMWEGV